MSFVYCSRGCTTKEKDDVSNILVLGLFERYDLKKHIKREMDDKKLFFTIITTIIPGSEGYTKTLTSQKILNILYVRCRDIFEIDLYSFQ